jgi:hypothetical protein
MSSRLYAQCILGALSLVFLLGTVWSSYISPFTGISFDRVYDLKRHLVLGFAMVSAFIFLFVRRPVLLLPSKKTLYVLALFFIFGCFSTLLSDRSYWGWVELSNYGVLCGVFILLAYCVANLEYEDILFGVYLTILVFTLFLFVRFFLNLGFYLFDSSEPTIHQLIEGFANARFMNQLQVALVPLLVLSLFSPRLNNFYRISQCLLIFHIVILLQTQARGAGLSIVLSIASVWLLTGKNNRVGLVWGLLKLFLMAILLWLILIVLLPYLLIGDVPALPRTGTSGRFDIWLYALTNIKDSFFLGFGPMSFSWAEGKPLQNAHLHNSVLQLMYEHGVIVMLFLVGWVLTLLRREFCLLIAEREQSELNRVVVFSTVLGLLFYSLLSGVVVMPLSQLMLVFCLALYVQYEKETGKLKLNVYQRVGFCVFICALSIAVILSKSMSMEAQNFPRIWVDSP